MKNGENGKRLIFPRVFGWVNEKVEEFFFFWFGWGEKWENGKNSLYKFTHISLLKKIHIKKKKSTNQKMKKQSPFMPSLKKKKEKKRKESKLPKNKKKRKEKANNQQKQVIMPNSKINK